MERLVGSKGAHAAGGLSAKNKGRERAQRIWLILFALLQMTMGGLAIGYAVYTGQKKLTIMTATISGICVILPSLLGILGACLRRPGLLLYYFMSVILGLCVFIATCLVVLTVVSIGCDLNQNASRNCGQLSCSATNSCSASNLSGTDCKALPTDVCDHTTEILAWSLSMVLIVSLIQIVSGYLTMSLRSQLLNLSTISDASTRR